jgi:hypothetical protein
LLNSGRDADVSAGWDVEHLTEVPYPLSRSSEAGVDSMTGASLYQPDLI